MYYTMQDLINSGVNHAIGHKCTSYRSKENECGEPAPSACMHAWWCWDFQATLVQA